jgi:Bardet-Biedl syndrome 5 protein
MMSLVDSLGPPFEFLEPISLLCFHEIDGKFSLSLSLSARCMQLHHVKQRSATLLCAAAPINVAMDGDYEGFWQDCEIRFDVCRKDLATCPGEFEIETLDNIEDSKGNSGGLGQLRLTNIRILWLSSKSSKTNLSIGFNCVLSINIRTNESRTRGASQALYVVTKFAHSKFEFIFSHESRHLPRLFSTIQSLYNAFDTSRLYRDIKLRGGIVRDKAVTMLPGESIISSTNGVWNLSGDQGNLGTLVVTNVRVVWFASLTENFNASVPFMQIMTVSKKLSKFGAALVLETTSRSGSFILGFRVDPSDKLDVVLKVSSPSRS